MSSTNDALTMRYKWVPELHPEGNGVLINEYLNDTLQRVRHAEDGALKTIFVTYLRKNGYIVIEPKEES